MLYTSSTASTKIHELKSCIINLSIFMWLSNVKWQKRIDSGTVLIKCFRGGYEQQHQLDAILPNVSCLSSTISWPERAFCRCWNTFALYIYFDSFSTKQRLPHGLHCSPLGLATIPVWNFSTPLYATHTMRCVWLEWNTTNTFSIA